MYQSWNFFNTFESQSTNVSYLDFGLKPAVFSCLNNALAPQLIVLESCSSSQTDQPVVSSALHKKFFGWELGIFYE